PAVKLVGSHIGPLCPGDVDLPAHERRRWAGRPTVGSVFVHRAPALHGPCSANEAARINLRYRSRPEVVALGVFVPDHARVRTIAESLLRHCDARAVILYAGACTVLHP